MKSVKLDITIGDIKKYQWSIAASVIVVMIMAVAYLTLIAPITDRKQMLVSKIEHQQKLISEYERKLSQSKVIRENLAKHEGALRKMKKRLFRGTDPYQLAASLGDLLSSNSKADAPKLDIKTYQVLTSKEHGLYEEVHMRFNLMTDIYGLHYFLTRVKNSEFAIQVKEINIQKIQRVRGPDLIVNVILAALMEKGKKS
ncbi:MAG: hypothetical protein M0Z81_15925 [Deltaproteobacteria bacterium]|jgi:hypothetical protein|nr:hypothetical protein [Deltaproteobacteria bacterium]